MFVSSVRRWNLNLFHFRYHFFNPNGPPKHECLILWALSLCWILCCGYDVIRSIWWGTLWPSESVFLNVTRVRYVRLVDLSQETFLREGENTIWCVSELEFFYFMYYVPMRYVLKGNLMNCAVNVNTTEHTQ